MRIVLAIKKERCDAKVKTLPPDANDFARMIERYNREMQQYVAINPRPEPAPPDGSPTEQAAFAEAPAEELRQAAAAAAAAPAADQPSAKDRAEDPIAPAAETAAEPEEAPVPAPADADTAADIHIDTDIGTDTASLAAATPSSPEEAMLPRSREIPYPSTEGIAPLIQTRDDSDKPEKPAEPYPRNAVGFLIVQAFSARGVLPVEGATVTVSGTENDKTVLYHTVFTDRSGLSPLMSLPAVSAQLSMKPGAYQPYTVYTVRVQKAGYYPVENTRVPIYEGVVARQPVNLVPLPENQREGKPHIFPENGPADL